MDDKGNFKGGGFSYPKSHDEILVYCDQLDAELRKYLSTAEQTKIDLVAPV